ncbi:hypothetical protein ACQPT2_17960 [Erwinia amylovora]
MSGKTLFISDTANSIAELKAERNEPLIWNFSDARRQKMLLSGGETQAINGMRMRLISRGFPTVAGIIFTVHFQLFATADNFIIEIFASHNATLTVTIYCMFSGIDCAIKNFDYDLQQLAQCLPPVDIGEGTVMSGLLLFIVMENLCNVNKTPSSSRIRLCCNSADCAYHRLVLLPEKPAGS